MVSIQRNGQALAALLVLLAAAPAWAQDAGGAAVPPAPAAAAEAAPAAPDQTPAPGVPEAARPSFSRFVAPSIGLRETFTNNATLGTGLPARSGFVSDVTAALALGVLLPQWRVNGRFQLDGYGYLPEHSQDRVIPYGSLDSTWEPVANHLFLDSGILSTRVLQSPYGVASAVGPTGATSTLTQLRIGPRLEGELGGDRHYELRSQNGWSTPVANPTSGGTRPGSFTTQNSAEVEQRPVPLGAAINVEDDVSHYTAPVDVTLRDEVARLILRYRLGGQFLVGLHGGGERLSYTIDGRSQGRVLGAEIAWRPTERTSVVGYEEARFYGPVWDLALRHRAAFVALDVTGSRRTTTAPQSLLALSGIGDLQRMVEAIYVARYPDPADRARAVDQLLEQTGTASTSATAVYTPDLALQTTGAATIGYLGPRDVASLTFTSLRHQSLDVGAVKASLFAFTTGPYRDTHAGLTLSHRLQPELTVTLKASSDQIDGLDAFAANHNRTRQQSLEASEHFSPRLDGVLGTLHQSASTTVIPGASQTAVYAGLAYRL